MGACYSCKSTEPNTHHSTAPMASDNKSSRRTTPYSRSSSLTGHNANNTVGSAASQGFGFKKKNPIIIQSSDRTNNLVKKYEKINLKSDSKGNSSIKNNSNIVAPAATSIPRIGYRSNTSAKSQPVNKNNKSSTNTLSDAGHLIEKINNNVPSQTTNVIINKDSTSLSNTQQIVDNQSNINHQKRTDMLKKQFLGSDFSINHSQTSDIPCKSLTSQKVIPQCKVTFRSGSQNSLNEKSNANRNSYSGPTSNLKSGFNGSKVNSQQSLNGNSKSESKIPNSRISTQYSGLRKPSNFQNENNKGSSKSYITISYKAPSRFMSANNLNSKPKLQRFASNDLPVKSDESLQDEVAMQTSIDTLPDENLVDSDMKLSGQLPSDADSGLGSSMKSSFDTEIRNGDSGTLAEVDEIDPLSQKSTTPNSFGSPAGGSIISDTIDGQTLRKPLVESEIDLLQASIEQIKLETVSPRENSIQLTSHSEKPSVASNISPITGAKASTNEKNEFVRQDSESKSLRDSFSSSKGSDRTETFSPTSDLESRSEFLIDDEIADQPSLMVLNDPKKNNLLTQSFVEPTKLSQEGPEIDITKDDSFTREYMSKPPSNVRRSLSFKSTDRQSSPIGFRHLTEKLDYKPATSTFKQSLMWTEQVDLKTGLTLGSNAPCDFMDKIMILIILASLVRQRLASIRNRSRTASSPDMTQSLIEMPRHRSHSTPLKPPRPIRILSENESTPGAVTLDPPSYRSLCQDGEFMDVIMAIAKLNFFDQTLSEEAKANSVYQRVASFEAPHGLSTCQEDDREQAARAENLIQENADLRRQIVFLEQQNSEKDRTIKLLQQQMTKYSYTVQNEEKADKCNAATQTVKMKSTTSMDGISPTTVR
ncbi:hypothetical protein GQR58_008787 [Nymphon striatum]|nr:hypothetical protein GQR58_008787 [Nymphon striatum]